LFVLDIGIDFVWAQPSVLSSDEPDLNRRGQQLVDRRAVVAEPISGGRGKIRLGDSLWLAEGPDMEVGTAVRIRAAHGTVLEVEPAE
jgi:membrane protein implicated in regulation of membrane protease activity